MIETLDKSVRYILKYKPFTYILSIFMAIYMAQLYPQSNTSLPLLLGLMFQNQLLRLVLLILIIYISQYNFYLSSIMVIMLIGSYMLSDQFKNIPLEGFTNDTDNNNDNKSNNNSNDNKSNNNSNDNKSNDNKTNDDKDSNDMNNIDIDDEDDYIDLDDTLEETKIKEKFQKIAQIKGNNKEAKTISECINLISTLPSDGDDTYKKFLQNLAAQRKAYLDMIKNKDDPVDIETAKLQYRKMCKYLTEEFLNDIDDEEYNDENNED